jgi:hypothetical protein
MNIDFKDMLDSLMDFACKRLNIQSPPSIYFDSDRQNSENPLGKTGFYNPNNQEVHIFVDGRHPKDIMRSLSHELVHHRQNEKGLLDDDGYQGLGYAQKNPHLRKMEIQANQPMLFRDWEDNYKLQQESKMDTPLKEWRLKELQKQLMKKFGIKPKETKKEKKNEP